MFFCVAGLLVVGTMSWLGPGERFIGGESLYCNPELPFVPTSKVLESAGGNAVTGPMPS
jgi:hypothetical protein